MVDLSMSFLKLIVISNRTKFSSEKRFNAGLSIIELKNKLELITGALTPNMELQILDENEKLVCNLNDDGAFLSSYPIMDGMYLNVLDKAYRSDLEESEPVEHFAISDESYSKRDDTVRSFLQKNRFGKYNEEAMAAKQKELEAQLEAEKVYASKLMVGNRCKVTVKDQPNKIGSIQFIGVVSFKPGVWVGVQYDEPVGKNDGSVEGKRYFTCPPKYGAFVKPTSVEMGDFPEEDLQMDEDEF